MVCSAPTWSRSAGLARRLGAPELKTILRSAAARTKDALWATFGEALDAFPETECRNYLAHCGYEFT
jgi:hypothetical protein